MLFLYLLVPAALAIVMSFHPEPATLGSKAEVRSLECTRVRQQDLHDRAPSTMASPPSRILPTDQVDALVCKRRFVRVGERPSRDEAILSSLQATVQAITQHALLQAPDGVLWHVDAFYPDPNVAGKLAGAARVDLAERGGKVSDRVPVLAAGDLAVLGPLPPQEAYPLACTRWFAEGGLREGDGFLALLLLDPRETQLRAGMCVGGRWVWLS